VIVGTQSTGQGHETSFAQVIADLVGVTPDRVRLVSGDTATVTSGGGTHSDRSMRLAGTLMVEACGHIRERGRRIAAVLLDADPEVIAFTDGLFSTPNSNQRLTVFDLAHAADGDARLPAELRAPLSGEAAFTGRIPAHPTGTAVCELEVDPETGSIEVTRYTSVDDVGQPINPLILHGQVHGGIAQGMGQALTEGVVYEAGTGQILTGSFTDYALPVAGRVPSFTVAMTEDPTSGNPLRVKGGGESGITPALATVINALADALSPLGIRHIDMPATPARVWHAIQHASLGQQR
jgi:carbon-monoxide dehydrogenase large subunit